MDQTTRPAAPPGARPRHGRTAPANRPPSVPWSRHDRPAERVSSAAPAQQAQPDGSVLTAEYFGPASAVCSRLTASGVNSFTAGGQGTCRHAFDAVQSVLRHKTPGVDDSGFTAREWRKEVARRYGPPEAQHPRRTRHRDRSQRNPRSDNPRQDQRPVALHQLPTKH